MKTKDLIHPVLAAKNVRSALARRIHMLTFASHGKKRFRADGRYDLGNVTQGFLSSIDDTYDDSQILDRICESYQAAIRDGRKAEKPIGSSASDPVLHPGLTFVRQALLTKNSPALARMYRNFYRDSCSSGLLAAPGGMAKQYFSGKIKDIYRNFYLSHVLYRLDYWRELTEGKYPLKALSGPGIGNPYGVVIGGTHIAVGSEYAHYCAHRVIEQLGSGNATVAEMKGGFGGIAYYLLRDRPGTRYIDIDIPEYLALASYYLMRAFPDRKVLLYGERPLSANSIGEADIVCIPESALGLIPQAAADQTFTSHGFSKLPAAAIKQWLYDVGRITRSRLFLIGNRASTSVVDDAIQSQNHTFEFVETRQSGWHSHKISGAGVGGAAKREPSMIVEQSYAIRRDLH